MKSFKDFGIKILEQSLTGDKIKMNRVLNREIIVHGYKLGNSKFEGKGALLTLQIELNNTKHIIFTSSTVLADAVKQIPDNGFPFKTTIIQDSNERYEFT